MSEMFGRVGVIASCALAATLALSFTTVGPARAATVSIAQIQGTDLAKSAFAGSAVTTEGFVTAVYASGGFDGYVIQSPGTGGAISISTHRASDALFVYSPSTAANVRVGDFVQVTGKISEYGSTAPYGTQTQITVTGAANLTKLDPKTAKAPTPALVGLPGSNADRETLEAMLVQPQGAFTVNEVYNVVQYGEIDLAAGTSPLKAPNSVARAGTPENAAVAVSNIAASITLDDGASTNYATASRTSIPNAYLGISPRVGAGVTFRTPVIFDYRYDKWRLQPTTALTGDNEVALGAATFTDTRTDSPKDVGGGLRIGTFNVLNYFPTTGDSRTGCTYHKDRAGTPLTVDDGSAAGCGVRGAATSVSFARQQRKIVNAILGLKADVLSLEELENSGKLGPDRDASIANLVAALNTRSGGSPWAFVPSPAHLPPLADQDVIRTGFIYRADRVELVGDSVVLTGSAPFANAREPEAQAFRPIWGDPEETFLVISNHFKSKNSEGAKGDNVDRGQGSYNGDRVRQANALLTFSTAMQAAFGTDKVFLVGDFNAMDKEDPVLTIAAAGYQDLGAATGKATYVYDGSSGSLDHVFASAAAAGIVTGADIWNVNSVEPLTSRYSHYNYNAVNPFNPKTPFGASDHDPIVVGLDVLTHTPPVDGFPKSEF